MALTKSATARRLTAAMALAAGALASAAQSQALGQFHQGEAREERLAVNRAIQQCTRMIQQKTAPARVSLLGPCRKPSGEFERLLGYAAEPEMVHRDNMVLMAVTR